MNPSEGIDAARLENIDWRTGEATAATATSHPARRTKKCAAARARDAVAGARRRCLPTGAPLSLGINTRNYSRAISCRDGRAFVPRVINVRTRNWPEAFQCLMAWASIQTTDLHVSNSHWCSFELGLINLAIEQKNTRSYIKSQTNRAEDESSARMLWKKKHTRQPHLQWLPYALERRRYSSIQRDYLVLVALEINALMVNLFYCDLRKKMLWFVEGQKKMLWLNMYTLPFGDSCRLDSFSDKSY